MTYPKLSICIPTYNRGPLIDNALESIAKQNLNDYIEVVISDNASIDFTAEVLQKWSLVFPNFVTYRFDENQGADRNYVKVISLARGQYVWFFGSDDEFTLGSIQRILNEIESHKDIYIFNRQECNYEMVFQKAKSFWRIPQNRDYDFSNRKHVLAYIYSSIALGGLFSYLSSIVIKKSTWDAMGIDESYYGSAYVHVYPLLKILRTKGTLRALDDHLVKSRGDNDSFDNRKSTAQRLLIDFRGYGKLIDSLFSDWPEAKQGILNSLCHNHNLKTPKKHLEYIKIRQTSTNEDWKDYKDFIEKFYGKQWRLILSEQPKIICKIGTLFIEYFAKPFIKFKLNMQEKKLQNRIYKYLS